MTGGLLTHCPPRVLAQILGQPSPSPAAGEVDIRPLMSIEQELEAAQSVLDNANYSLANALALDQPPEETETNFLEQHLCL